MPLAAVHGISVIVGNLSKIKPLKFLSCFYKLTESYTKIMNNDIQTYMKKDAMSFFMPTPRYNVPIAVLKMIISPLHFLRFLSYTETRLYNYNPDHG